MSRFELICPRCGRPNQIDLTERVAGLRCRFCAGFLDAPQLRELPSPDHTPQRRRIRRSAGDGKSGAVWQDQESAVSGRTKWPRWFKIFLPVCCAGLIVPLVVMIRQRARDTVPPEEKAPATPLPVMPPTDLRDADWMARARVKAEAVVSAPDVDSLLPHIIHDGVPVETVRKYYADHPDRLPAGKLTGICELPDGDFGESLALIEFEDISMRRRRLCAVDRGSGIFIDWPSMVCLSDMTLVEFKKQRPVKAVNFRFVARRVDYYNFRFSDQQRWLSLELSDAEGDTIFGYLDRSHPAAAYLQRMPPGDAGMGFGILLPLHASLAYLAPDAPPDQAEIKEIHGLSWYVKPAPPKPPAAQGP